MTTKQGRPRADTGESVQGVTSDFSAASCEDEQSVIPSDASGLSQALPILPGEVTSEVMSHAVSGSSKGSHMSVASFLGVGSQVIGKGSSGKKSRHSHHSVSSLMSAGGTKLAKASVHAMDSLIDSCIPEGEEPQHPLAANAPEAAANIRFVRLDYFMQLLHDTSKPLPRCQDLPEYAFGSLKPESLLVGVSHGWFFQCHPDPLGSKMQVLRNLFQNLRVTYPVVDILVFFDFLSLTQRPYKEGQKQRTEEQQRVFMEMLGQMHNAYVYSDALIHIHSDPPSSDTVIHETTIDMGKVALAQIGEAVQVVSYHDEALTAFDIIKTIDGDPISRIEEVPKREAVVGYLKRPFGTINTIDVDIRGWVYLERFITMLKAAMVDEEAFNKCVFTNSEKTKAILVAGSEGLREASKNGPTALMKKLVNYQEELRQKKFSASSTDKLLIDGKASSDGDALSEDAAIVLDLMEQLVVTFSLGWADEQHKQQKIAKRLKVDVPLLHFTPRTRREAICSFEPAVLIACIASFALAGALITAAAATAVLAMDANGVAMFSIVGVVFLIHFVMHLTSQQHDVGLSQLRIFINHLPGFFGPGMAIVGLHLVMVSDLRWYEGYAHVLVFFIGNTLNFIINKTSDVMAFYTAPRIQESFKTNGWRYPRITTKLKKGFMLGMLLSVMFTFIYSFMLACVTLRNEIRTLSPMSGSMAVLGMSAAKQALMFIITSIALPKMSAHFGGTDATLCSLNATVTFGTRFLVTSLSSNSAIFAVSVVTSVAEMGSSVMVLHHSFRHVCKLEADTAEMEAKPPKEASDAVSDLRLCMSQENERSEEQSRLATRASTESDRCRTSLTAKKKLWKARRRMSTEVIFLLNELFTEFYTTVAAVLCGIILRDSSVVTLLSSNLTWDELVPFLAVQCIPEVLDAWLIIVYLRYLGLDWPALGRSLIADSRFLVAKAMAVLGSFLIVMSVGIDPE